MGPSQVALVVKNLPANVGDIRDAGSIPGLERSSREENGNPLQSSCLGNPMDRGDWLTTVCAGCIESDMTERLTHSKEVIHLLSKESASCISFKKVK